MGKSNSIGTFLLVVFLIVFFIGVFFSAPRVYTGGVVAVAPYPVFGVGYGGPSLMVNHTTVSGPSHAPSAPRFRSRR